MEQMPVRIALVLLAAAFLASTSTMVAVSARYLPTRSQKDRLERLRELLKDLFDSDYEHNRAYPLPDVAVLPERAAIYKRSVGLPYPSGQQQQQEMVKGLVVSRHGSPLVSGDEVVLGLGRGNGIYDSSSYGNPERKVMK